MPVDEEYYKILQVSTSASPEEIKKAYKKLAMKYHPDKSSEPDAEQKFKELSTAYEVLSDPERKRMYDQFGKNAPDQPHSHSFNPADLFGNIFGGFNQRPQQQNSLPMIHITIDLNLQEIYNGVEKNITYNRYNFEDSVKMSDIQCSECKGSGHKVIIRQMGPMIQQMMSRCESCNGSGWTLGKYFQEEFTHTIKIPKGITADHKIHFENFGHKIPESNSKTPVIISFNINNTFTINEFIYTKNGNNLLLTLPLDIHKVICGSSETIDFINNTKKTIEIPEKIFNGEIKIPGSGLPIYGSENYGDLLITTKINDFEIKSKDEIIKLFTKN